MTIKVASPEHHQAVDEEHATTDKRGGKMEKRGVAAAAEVKRKTFIADAIAKPPSRRTKREREAIAQAIKEWEQDQARRS
jgi:hypothetical protein